MIRYNTSYKITKSQNSSRNTNSANYKYPGIVDKITYMWLTLSCPSYYTDFAIFSVKDVILRVCDYRSVYMCFDWASTSRSVWELLSSIVLIFYNIHLSNMTFREFSSTSTTLLALQISLLSLLYLQPSTFCPIMQQHRELFRNVQCKHKCTSMSVLLCPP